MKKKSKVEPEQNQERMIRIPKLEAEQAICTIRGITSLITSRMNEKTLDLLEGNVTGAGSVQNNSRNPTDEYKASRYLINKVDCFPAMAIKKSMLAAGYRFANEKMTELAGVFSIPQEYLVITNPSKQKDWPTCRRDYVRPQGRGLATVYRAEYQVWQIEVPIVFCSNFISLDQVVTLLMLAGQSVGIGAWRVEKKGVHGQWTVAGVRQEVVTAGGQ